MAVPKIKPPFERGPSWPSPTTASTRGRVLDFFTHRLLTEEDLVARTVLPQTTGRGLQHLALRFAPKALAFLAKRALPVAVVAAAFYKLTEMGLKAHTRPILPDEFTDPANTQRPLLFIERPLSPTRATVRAQAAGGPNDPVLKDGPATTAEEVEEIAREAKEANRRGEDLTPYYVRLAKIARGASSPEVARLARDQRVQLLKDTETTLAQMAASPSLDFESLQRALDEAVLRREHEKTMELVHLITRKAQLAHKTNVLISLAQHPSPLVRSWLVMVSAEDPIALQEFWELQKPLIEADLQNPDEIIRGDTVVEIVAFAKVGFPEATQWLSDLADHSPDPEIRKKASFSISVLTD